MPRQLSKGVIKLVAPSCDKIWYYLKVWPGPSSIFNWYLFNMIQKHLNIVKSFEKFVKQECVHKQWPHMQMKLLTTQGYLNIYLLFYCVWILSWLAAFLLLLYHCKINIFWISFGKILNILSNHTFLCLGGPMRQKTRRLFEKVCQRTDVGVWVNWCNE